MEIIALALLGIGSITIVIGSIWMVIEAFKTSILWGLGFLFLPFGNIIWLVTHWEEGKKPFLITLGGLGVMLLAGLFGGSFSTPPV